MEIKFDEAICALILLASLPNSCEPMRAAITNSIRNAKLKFVDVRNIILMEEVCRKDSSEVSTSNSSLNVDNRGRSFERNSNKGDGNRGKSKNGRGKLKNGRNLECWNYGKITGHPKKNCRTPMKNEDKNYDVANVVIDEVRGALILSVDDSCDSWLIYSGALFHTIAQCDVLENYVARSHRKVYMADGVPLDIIGMSDVSLKMPNGSVWKIQNVRHVLSLMRNLISVRQLEDKGHNDVFNNGGWKVTKGAMVIT